MPKMYEITADYDRLSSMDMETDGDVEAFLSLLKELEGTFDQKAENYCKLIRNLEADAEAYKVEKDRLAKKQKSIENRVEEIKKYLQYEASKIIETGTSRKVGLFTLAIRLNPEAVEVFSEEYLAERYYKVVRTLDTAFIKETLKSGVVVNGARLVRGTSLRIS
jgi:predicted  nucleic acid-binding Zn-ribbon protein